MTPDHFIVRDTALGNFGYVNFVPVGEDRNQNKFAPNASKEGDPFLVQTDSPSIYINGIGTLFSGSVLDSNGETVVVKTVIQSEAYARNSNHLDNQLWFNLFLFTGTPKNEIENFLVYNNKDILNSYGYTTKLGTVTIKKVSTSNLIIDNTFFTIGYANSDQ